MTLAPTASEISDAETLALLRAFFNLVRRWALNHQQGRILLGGPAARTYARWKTGQVEVSRVSRDTRALGLDVPVHVQYGRWLGGILLHGTLGDSLLGHWSVEERIIGRLPVTIELGLLSIVIGLLIALPVGIYSAIRQDAIADYLGRSIAIIGLATPNFWLALVMLFPAIWWGWSPPLELIPFTEDPLGNLGVFIWTPGSAIDKGGNWEYE